jgi:hypothetical protein
MSFDKESPGAAGGPLPVSNRKALTGEYIAAAAKRAIV